MNSIFNKIDFILLSAYENKNMLGADFEYFMDDTTMLELTGNGPTYLRPLNDRYKSEMCLSIWYSILSYLGLL